MSERRYCEFRMPDRHLAEEYMGEFWITQRRLKLARTLEACATILDEADRMKRIASSCRLGIGALVVNVCRVEGGHLTFLGGFGEACVACRNRKSRPHGEV